MQIEQIESKPRRPTMAQISAAIRRIQAGLDLLTDHVDAAAAVEAAKAAAAAARSQARQERLRQKEPNQGRRLPQHPPWHHPHHHGRRVRRSRSGNLPSCSRQSTRQTGRTRRLGETRHEAGPERLDAVSPPPVAPKERSMTDANAVQRAQPLITTFYSNAGSGVWHVFHNNPDLLRIATRCPASKFVWSPQNFFCLMIRG